MLYSLEKSQELEVCMYYEHPSQEKNLYFCVFSILKWSERLEMWHIHWIEISEK